MIDKIIDGFVIQGIISGGGVSVYIREILSPKDEVAIGLFLNAGIDISCTSDFYIQIDNNGVFSFDCAKYKDVPTSVILGAIELQNQMHKDLSVVVK